MTDDIHALSGAHALDALSEHERVAFEEHLEQCAPCRVEVRDFRAVGADLAGLVEEPPPAGLRERVLAATASAAAGTTVQWATRELLGARSRQEVADVLLEAVQRLGGRVVRADHADRGEDPAIPLDISLGGGRPLLATAAPDSEARRDLERHLPQLVEDARTALETIQRSRHEADQPAGSKKPGRQR